MRRCRRRSKPASLHNCVSASGSPSAKNSGHTSVSTSASTIGNTGDQPQFTRFPQIAMTTRPPGFSTRRHSRTALCGSGRYIKPSAHSTTSNDASGRSSVSASMR
jgi:hypothetical protein